MSKRQPKRNVIFEITDTDQPCPNKEGEWKLLPNVKVKKTEKAVEAQW